MSEEFSLKESAKSLGQLVPILKDKHGNIIDGFHRLGEVDKDWHSVTVETVDTPVKLELARLVVNFARRKVPESEMQTRIAFLIKQGLSAKDIAVQSGISEATIYRHMPKELKSENSEAISEGRKRQVSLATSCDNCKLTVSQEDLKPWNGNKLCGRCYAQALDHPAQFHQRLEPPKIEPKTIEPPFKDTWEYRKGQMQVPHSKQELEFVKLAQDDSMLQPVITDRAFYAVKSVPDAFLVRHNVVVYVDGEVHNGREDRDDKLREQIAKTNNVKVFVFKIGEGKPADWVKRLKEKL